MPDSDTSMAQLRDMVAAFVAERNWEPYHNAKDLAVAIAIEAAELMEEFQWQDPQQVAAASADPEARERIRFELADVLIYCLGLANALELDVSQAISDKLVIAGQKYPAEHYRGHYRRPRQHLDFTVD